MSVFVSPHLKHIFAVLAVIGLVAGLGLWPLQAYESGFSWLIFYPVVISVALYAGFLAGLLATVLACIAAGLLWPLFVNSPFVDNRFDLLALAIFAVTGSFIAYCINAVQRAKAALVLAEARLKHSVEAEQFTRTIINNSPNMMGYWDRDLRCRYANSAYSDWFDMPAEDIIGLKFQELVDEQLFSKNEPHIQNVLAGEPQRFERTLSKVDGSVGHIIGHYIPDFDTDGTVKGFSIQASEVTVLKEAEANLKLAACVFDNTLDGVLITDADGIILSVNPSFVEITGYTAEESVGLTPRILQSNLHDHGFYASMWEGLKATGRWKGEIWNRRKDGELYLQRMTVSIVHGEDGEPERYVSVFSDVTALWRKDEHIKHLAFHDALTDLPNRTLLMDRINQKLLRSNREQNSFALMFLDLDGFKYVNDRFGHHVGDDLLKSVAKRLLALVRKSDTVARVGGDEFIFILNNPHGREDVLDVANRIVSSVGEPIEFLDETHQIGVSIGISVFPADGATSVDLIRNADTAMYAAKKSGRNSIKFFSS